MIEYACTLVSEWVQTLMLALILKLQPVPPSALALGLALGWIAAVVADRPSLGAQLCQIGCKDPLALGLAQGLLAAVVTSSPALVVA